MKLKSTSLLIAGALFGAAMLPAQANNEAMADLLKVLRDKGTISSEDYNMLQNAAAADKEKTEAAQAEVKKQVAEATADMPVITTDGKIKIESRDGAWSFQPIGRVMWDAIDTDEDDSGADDFDGTELRRARLGFEGSIYDWGYKFEADFATGGNSGDSSEVSIKDAFISYGNKMNDMAYGVKLGQSHVAYGLNTKISSKYMTFMDRPWFADSSVSPARESGVVASLADKDYKWTLSAGLTNGEIDGGSSEENGSTFSARASFVPYMQDKNHLIQVGAGFLSKGGGDNFRFRQRLVSHKDATRHLDTAQFEIDGANAYTLDAMGIFGSFHAMAEYNDFTAERTAGSDVDITGYAVEAGYFLTGESLKWKKGYTSGISPKSSAGAWQVAARFETLEIDDSANSDEADKWTVGVNYYPTKNTRLMLNYDKVTDLKVDGSSVNYEPSALKFRAQAYW
ncbi:MAG TPA: porin [Methylophaga aminisulfidivorans]|uniref:Porin n=1 Tax=Methylophaga aminisulfidivorans TaxID=230105 RepID=A0A7C2AQW9_9GAMM|nr:porin [Methylophaga aminisulfidivorans]